MIEIKYNWFAQGLIVGVALGIINLIFKFIKELISSQNPMTRYVTFYITLILALIVDLLITTYFAGEWSSDLIEKPLCIITIIALVYALFNIRKNRIDKNKFTEITHNLIEVNLVGSSKQLCIKIDSIVERYAAMGYTLMPGQMFSEIADVYSNEVSIRFEIIWNIFIKTLKVNKPTLTTNTFKKKIFKEFKASFSKLEKSFGENIERLKEYNEEAYLRLLLDIKLEMHRLQAKYKTEVSLLSNDKIFIHNHIP